MKVDDHGFPMRDDLDQMQTTTRTIFDDGDFRLSKKGFLKKYKRKVKQGRLKGASTGVSSADKKRTNRN